MFLLRIIFSVSAFFLIASSSLYSEESSADPIATKYLPQFEKLKADYEVKLNLQRKAMLPDYETLIKKLTEDGNLERVNEIKGQLELLKSKIEATEAPKDTPKLSAPDPVQKKYQGKLDALKVDFGYKTKAVEKAANVEYEALIKRASQSGKLDLANSIKEQQKAFSNILRPDPASQAFTEEDSEASKSSQITKAVDRFHDDAKNYTKDEMEDIERTYQEIKKCAKLDDKKEKLNILLTKYPKASRTGTAVYLVAYTSSGKEREKYLKLIIDVYGDCAMGNGFPVGPWARYLLAKDYYESGDKKKAKILMDDIKTNYPEAVNPNTKERLVTIMEREFADRKRK